jgi:multidrug resistance efflux pump
MKRARTLVVVLVGLVVVVTGGVYVLLSLRKASAPPAPSRTPSLSRGPVRLYGLVEPLHREALVGPQQARRVNRVLVQEGQEVSAGQVLCELEQEVERQSLEVAVSRAREAEARRNLVLDELKRTMPLSGEGLAGQRALRVAVQRLGELKARLDLVLDELNRKKRLLQSNAIAEQEYSQKALEAEVLRRQIATATSQAVSEYSQKSLEERLLRRQIETARAEVELRRRELETFTLRSPIHGRLYKFDVRLGEQLTPQDHRRIVIGSLKKQVRLFVEAFWLDKVRVGDVFQVQDVDTMRTIGSGRIVAVSEYVGARDFRSEDTFERLDTKYAQAILEMEDAPSVSLGKLVLCVRPDSLGEREKTQPR